MKSWNYRVLHETGVGPEGEPWETYAIHEVYYADEEQTQVAGWTENPAAVLADDQEGLKWVLGEMLKAIDKPVLDRTGGEAE